MRQREAANISCPRCNVVGIGSLFACTECYRPIMCPNCGFCSQCSDVVSRLAADAMTVMRDHATEPAW